MTGSTVMGSTRASISGNVFHSKEYNRAPTQNNSTVLYKAGGKLTLGAIQSFVTVNSQALAFVRRITPTRNGLQLSAGISSTVVATLQDRLFCCVLSNEFDVICLSDKVEKCLCVDVDCSVDFLYVVRFPNTLLID